MSGRSLSLACRLALGTVLAAGCGQPDPDTTLPFADPVTWPTGLPARALAVLDGGAAKVALAFQQQDEVGLLDATVGDLNPAAARVGDGPMAIASLDVDGDGSRELATANAGDRTVSLLGQTAGGLEVLATAELGAAPKHVVGADLDGDGAQELVVTAGLDVAEDRVEVWRQAAAGLEPVGSAWSLPGAFAAAAGDVDGDGDLDVIAVLQQADEIAWAANDGAGALTETGRAAVCLAPRAATMLETRIAVACRDGVVLVRPDGAEVERVAWDGNAYDLAAGDFDGDGRLDLVAADLAHDAVALWNGRADGGLADPISRTVGDDPVALVTADLAADGDLDLVVSAFATRTIHVLENQRSLP